MGWRGVWDALGCLARLGWARVGRTLVAWARGSCRTRRIRLASAVTFGEVGGFGESGSFRCARMSCGKRLFGGNIPNPLENSVFSHVPLILPMYSVLKLINTAD